MLWFGALFLPFIICVPVHINLISSSGNNTCIRGCGNGKCVFGNCFCDGGWSGISCMEKLCNPVDCLGNGVCSSGNCSCFSGWKGDSCSTILSLPMLAPIPEIGDPQWVAIDDFNCTIRFPEKSGVNGDQFISANITVTVDHECAKFVLTNEVPYASSHIPVSVHGDVFLQRAPYACMAVNLQATYGSQKIKSSLSPIVPKTGKEEFPSVLVECPNNCSGHGACVSGVCVCEKTWIGSCCCKQDRSDTRPAQVDPLAFQPFYPPFGGVPKRTDLFSNTHSFIQEEESTKSPVSDKSIVVFMEDDSFCIGSSVTSFFEAGATGSCI